MVLSERVAKYVYDMFVVYTSQESQHRHADDTVLADVSW
jgi:hypothetical protein